MFDQIYFIGFVALKKQQIKFFVNLLYSLEIICGYLYLLTNDRAATWFWGSIISVCVRSIPVAQCRLEMKLPESSLQNCVGACMRICSSKRPNDIICVFPVCVRGNLLKVLVIMLGGTAALKGLKAHTDRLALRLGPTSDKLWVILLAHFN